MIVVGKLTSNFTLAKTALLKAIINPNLGK